MIHCQLHHVLLSNKPLELIEGLWSFEILKETPCNSLKEFCRFVISCEMLPDTECCVANDLPTDRFGICTQSRGLERYTLNLEALRFLLIMIADGHDFKTKLEVRCTVSR